MYSNLLLHTKSIRCCEFLASRSMCALHLKSHALHHRGTCRTCALPETQGTPFWKPTISGEGICGGHLRHGQPVVCNTWVYCGEQQCFSFDIHNHSRGECWLKHVTNPERPEVCCVRSMGEPPGTTHLSTAVALFSSMTSIHTSIYDLKKPS